jgi:molybdate/tungstate transport system ATP-binding protein
MSEAGLAVARVSLRLGAFALREVSLAAAPGEVLVLLGRNGAGKSVCLETIAGFHKPQGGRILIAGRDVTQLPPERRRVGYVVQNFALFPHLSIAQNVAIGSTAPGDDNAVRGLLARFGIAHLAEARPAYLSPGEKQRAALARALASRPSVYLFDEPFAALDAATVETLGNDLAAFLRRAEVPAVFVTHDRADALALADRVAVIEDGVIRQEGSACEVFARPGSLAIARLLGFENLLPGRITAETSGIFRVAIGGVAIDVGRRGVAPAARQQVTLCIRAADVHLLPPHAAPAPNLLSAGVLDVRRAGPLWRVALDCGFPLVAYALPQTAQAAGLAPGSAIAAAIDPEAIHLLATPE